MVAADPDGAHSFLVKSSPRAPRAGFRREWDAKGTRLTRAELEAGIHCRGCGESSIDGLGDWRPLIRLNQQEKREHEDAQADFVARHPDCRGHRSSMRAPDPYTCGYCCPPSPLSERQLDEITRILDTSRPSPSDLRTWRVTSTCGHVSDVQQHKPHGQWTTDMRHCHDCDQTRGVVAVELPQNRRAPTQLRSRTSPYES